MRSAEENDMKGLIPRQEVEPRAIARFWKGGRAHDGLTAARLAVGNQARDLIFCDAQSPHPLSCDLRILREITMSVSTALRVFLASVIFTRYAWSAPASPPTLDPTYALPLPVQKALVPSAAQWVWAGKEADNQTIYLRRTFEVKSLHQRQKARLWVTADDFFSLWINGHKVTESVPDPNDQNVWQQVHRVDVTAFLQPGPNVVAVRALNKGAAAGVIARLELPDGTLLETDGRWKVWDENEVPDHWQSLAFDDSQWKSAAPIAPLSGGVWAQFGGLADWPGAEAPYLAHLTLPFAGVSDVHAGQGQIAGAEGFGIDTSAVLTVTPPPAQASDWPSLVLDVGKEVAGRVSIEALSSGTVSVGTGESLEEAVRAPWGGQKKLDLLPGTQATTPYSAFRFVRLAFPPALDGHAPDGQGLPLQLRVSVDHKYYPVRYQGTFDCSDPLLTKVWWTGAYCAHLCMQEEIWDAPKRDRRPWIGDLHVSGEVINNVFADRFLMERTITDLRDSAQGGRPPSELPASHVNDIPGYSAAWICALADFQRHQGDTPFLEKQHGPLLSLLNFMRAECDERDLFVNKTGKWSFSDWSPDFDGDSPAQHVATQLFYAKAAQEGAFLLREMGDKTGAAQVEGWSEALAVAARQNLSTGAGAAGASTFGNRLQPNAMAIYSGVATKEQRAAIYAQVLAPDTPAWNRSGALLGDRPVMSPYYGNYVLFAMSEAGHNADAMRVIRDFWGGMLAQGATTFWEAYDPRWPKEDFHAHLQADGQTGYFVSLCHGWSAGPTNWLTERVLGVRPTSGGFKTAEVAPDLGDLTWAQGDVPTPNGTIHERVQNIDGKMTLRLSLPPGVRADVSLAGTALEIDGRTATPARVEEGRAHAFLEQGTYTISST